MCENSSNKDEMKSSPSSSTNALTTLWITKQTASLVWSHSHLGSAAAEVFSQQQNNI